MATRRRTLKKIGIVTEGDSEVLALPGLYEALSERTSTQYLKPLRAAVDPLAPPPVVSRGCADRVRLSFAKGADLVVVLLDREGASQSAADRAADIEKMLAKDFGDNVRVVVKDRTFEHWLIAACGAFAAHPAKYPNAEKIKKGYTKGRADSCADAESLINRGLGKGKYEKTKDAPEILKSASIVEMATHSRSFRRFLAVCGDATYSNGSCTSLEPPLGPA
ncbi:DUF4276 family protein [Nocardioides pinisoli]|uniref:DUF4276 family protein n=1 Tax=Nocardioides pinisoli TaxID=2950279 RepID=A0ABT1KVJ3_9ACTN|nr:DUF4276 family protein [Nocardioides pinisoli]MCP3421359.1 DUF4276 family protein [Nocardioides pinisoli]